jgi:CAAX protease family protein
MKATNPLPKLTGPLAVFSASAAGWFAAVLLAMASVAPVRYFNFSDLLAAHISMGVFGLAGGLSHAWVIRAAGGNLPGIQGLLLSVVWAAVCIAGVTPLFFIIGTPVKMALLAFYSFAIFGSIGGRMTVGAVGSAFHRSDGGILRYVLAWGFGFGFAALAVNPASAFLKMLLPEGIALFLSIGIMALVIGAGAGYSLLTMVNSRTDNGLPSESDRPESARIDQKVVAEENGPAWFPLLFLMTAPFYLNDFSNIFIDDWRLWLPIDYGATKLFPLFLTTWLIRTGKIRCDQLGLTPQSLISFVVVFLIGTLIGMLILENGPLLMGNLPGYHRVGSMPAIESVTWKWIDLTAGLLLVGVCEELIFRGYLFAALSRYMTHRLALAAISALLFGLIHWSEGFHQVFITGAIGAVFMTLYLISKSLPAVMLAHFAVNFIHNAGFIPEAIFRFL